jgi:hypothetical protein
MNGGRNGFGTFGRGEMGGSGIFGGGGTGDGGMGGSGIFGNGGTGDVGGVYVGFPDFGGFLPDPASVSLSLAFLPDLGMRLTISL